MASTKVSGKKRQYPTTKKRRPPTNPVSKQPSIGLNLSPPPPSVIDDSRSSLDRTRRRLMQKLRNLDEQRRRLDEQVMSVDEQRRVIDEKLRKLDERRPTLDESPTSPNAKRDWPQTISLDSPSPKRTRSPPTVPNILRQRSVADQTNGQLFPHGTFILRFTEYQTIMKT